MKERFFFFLYILILFALSLLRTWYPFLIVIILCLPFVKKPARFFPVIFLLLVVSIPYLIWGSLKDTPPIQWFIIFNLRALSMLSLTLAFFSVVNPFKAIAFSRTLSTVLSLSYAQYLSFAKTYTNFKFALRSRTLEKLLGKSFYSYAGTIFKYFMDLSERRTSEVSQAMKSRGFNV